MPQETRRLLVLEDTFSFLPCQECMGKECVFMTHPVVSLSYFRFDFR